MLDQLESEGYCVVRRLLDPEQDIKPLERAYERLIDELLEAFGRDLPANRLEEYRSWSFPERIAAGIGISRGELLHHIDPVLKMFELDYRWQPELPDPRLPELFHLIRHPAIVDAVERHLGPRITASPVHHVNIKLPIAHIRLARRVAGPGSETLGTFQGVNLSKTHWHMDAIAGLKDSHASRIINAWVPINPATERNGCLRVVPRSHREGVRYPPYRRDLDKRSIALAVEPGDVVFLDNQIMHSSAPNTSRSDYRLAFNFRYLTTGQATGRPFLPEFVVRDRDVPGNELRDAALWSRMWRGCLGYHARHGLPVEFKDISTFTLEQAQELTRKWRCHAPDCESWARLSGGIPARD